ncbi:MAG: hypothetical protein U9O96_00175 [Candidatus Thermoplasmatota archaeon]|nr:hypothetical protein [Candidatus Thermoplasmatota archaeon]
MKTWIELLLVIAVAIASVAAGLIAFIYVGLTSPPEPLHFVIFNDDNQTHSVKVEIYDSKKQIFNESYLGEPEKIRESSSITNKSGEYLFKVAVNRNLSAEKTIEVKRNFVGVAIVLYREENKLLIDIEPGYAP